jgi:hypothetical protein
MFPIAENNGGRRSGIERRKIVYTIHIPERRSGNDRRLGKDRRNGLGTKRPDQLERREIFDQPKPPMI